METVGFGDITKTEIILCDVCNGEGKLGIGSIYDNKTNECPRCLGKGRLYKHVHVYYSNLED